MNESVSVLISEDDIEQRLVEIASKITLDYAGKKLYLVCLLKGGVIFMVDLARKIDLPIEFDFMDVSSYGASTESSGVIRIEKDLDNSVEGKNVLLVEDIVDSGRTISHVIRHLKSQNPESIKVCTLLNKPERRVLSDFNTDYVGFQIPDKFVVGYGLDYDQRYRNLPYIGILHFDKL